MPEELADYYDRKDPRYNPPQGVPRDYPLIGLLHHSEGQGRELEMLQQAGICFAGEWFAAARIQLVAVDAFAFLSSQNRQVYSEDQLAVAFVALGRQTLQTGSYLFEIQREVVLLVSGETAQQTELTLSDTLTAIQALAENLSGLRIFLTYSAPGEGVDSIPDSYQMCCMLQQWRAFHMNTVPVLGPAALDTPMEVRAQGPERQDIQREQEILHLFKGGQYREARAVLRQLFEEDYLALAEPLMLLKHKCAQYLSALAGTCAEICGEEFLTQLQELQPERQLLAAQNYPEVRAQMEHCFGHLNDLMLKLRGGDQRSWILQVQDYVRANYADPNLNVNSIADRFGKNAAWLSRCFLRYTGDSLPEYIHRYRIQEAKIRIGRGDTLAEVAEAVGYGSLITMSRAFKKYEGTTPGKLRQDQDSRSVPQ